MLLFTLSCFIISKCIVKIENVNRQNRGDDANCKSNLVGSFLTYCYWLYVCMYNWLGQILNIFSKFLYISPFLATDLHSICNKYKTEQNITLRPISKSIIPQNYLLLITGNV